MADSTRILQAAYSDLVTRMQSPDLVADFIHSRHKITSYELDSVHSLTSRLDKTSKLLDIVLARQDYEVFAALKDGLIDNKEQHLVDQWLTD